MVVADLSADLVFEAPGDPAQAVESVVAGGQDGLREQVADVGDAAVGEQVRAQPVRACRAGRRWAAAFPRLVAWSPAGMSVLVEVS